MDILGWRTSLAIDTNSSRVGSGLARTTSIAVRMAVARLLGQFPSRGSGCVRCDFGDEVGDEVGGDAVERGMVGTTPPASMRERAGWVMPARMASSTWDSPSSRRRQNELDLAGMAGGTRSADRPERAGRIVPRVLTAVSSPSYASRMHPALSNSPQIISLLSETRIPLGA
jgi:hypothetical protein